MNVWYYLCSCGHFGVYQTRERFNRDMSAVTYLLCGIYALVMVVLGLVFPISTSLTTSSPTEPKYYLENGTALHIMIIERLKHSQYEVFHLYIYVVSLFFLIYLHAYLLRQKCTDEKAARNIRLVSNNQLDSPDKSAFAVQVSTDKSPPTKPSRQYSPTDLYRGPEVVPKSESENKIRENSEISGSGHSEKHRSRTPSVDLEPYEPPRPVTYDAGGVNFYLRLGAIVFGVGTMVLDGFRIAQVFEVNNYWSCYGILAMVMSGVHLIFTFYQTYFLFKNHRIAVNKHKAFVRFGLTHIIATNICIWALAFIIETAEDYEDKLIRQQELEANSSSANNTTMATPPAMWDDPTRCYLGETLARKASPYLFSCVIMYSLIAAAIVYKMFQNVGKVGQAAISANEAEIRSQRDCHKANKGLFLGLFIAILTLISISCFFVFDQKFKNTDTASMIFYITELTLLFLSCLVVLIGFFKLQLLKFTSLEDGPMIEAPLLVIALFGLCVMNTFLIVSSASSFEQYGIIAILSLGTAILSFIQASIQTIFILDGLRRCAENDEQINNKPGRTLVTFLLLCNLSLFVVHIFEVRKMDTIDIHANYYGGLPWNIIIHLCIPLIIFFRFHSTVCLSEIWVQAYVMKKRQL